MTIMMTQIVEDENAHIINGSDNLACQQERHACAKTVQHLQLGTFVSGFFQYQ